MNPAATIQARRMRERAANLELRRTLEDARAAKIAAVQRARFGLAAALTGAATMAGAVWAALSGWLPGRLALLGAG